MTNGMNISNSHGNAAGANHGAAMKKIAIAGDNAPQNNALNGDVANTAASSNADSGVSPFQKIYNEIAKCNKIAQGKNGAKNGTESDTANAENAAGQDASIAALLSSEILKQLGATDVPQSADIQQILAGGMDPNSSANLSSEAAALIRDAIATITKTLNLKVQDGLENLSSISPCKAVIDQFAEMLSTLKGIAAVLDESVKMNQPLEYKTLAFDVSTAAKVQQTIHEQMFKIELALKMMGISGDVSAAMAQKDTSVQDAVAALSGIPQAADPSKLAMPSIHVKQVLGEVFVSREQKVETLLTKLAETLKKNGTADTAALAVKITGMAQSGAEKAKPSDMKEIGALDSQVMRRILKVDGALATAAENKNAAQQNVALGLPKDGKVFTSKTFADAIAGQKPTDTSDQTVPGGSNAASLSTDKLMSTLRTNETGTMRQLEESVMTQVAEKLNVAVKTGVTEIRVMLRPESLGDVQLKIKIEGDVVTGKMYVESQQVKHIVESNMQSLKDSLQQHNLSVGSFSVDINHGNGAYQQMQEMAQLNSDGSGNGNREGAHEPESTDGGAKTIVSGIETGRKYGTNTIEYFA